MKKILCKLFGHKIEIVEGHWVYPSKSWLNNETRYWVKGYNICSRCLELLNDEGDIL